MKAFGAVSVFSVSTFAVSMCLAAPVHAQSAPADATPAEAAPAQGGLAEIVVTATKRSENLQNVPVAVAAITAETLQNKGVFATSDLNNTIANFQVSSPYGEQQPNFSVRGVGVGTEFNANAASPVGVYVDEVYQAVRSSHGQQLYDLNQIEVVRGPQGTLYGRNTTGGAINFITHAPDLKGQNGYLTLGYGRFNRQNLDGAVEVTPVEGKLGIRFAVTYVDSEPYIKNVLPAGLNKSAAFGASGLNQNTGLSPGGTKSFAGRLTVRFRPTDAIDLKLKVYAGEAKGGTEQALPTGQSKTSDLISYTNPNFLLGPLFSALAPAGLLPTSYSQSGNGLSLNQVQVDTIGRATSRSKGAVFDARFQLTPSLKLISISGYDDGLYQQTQTDCDATPLRLCSIGYKSVFNAFNQDVRLDYNGGAFKMIVGGFYGKDTITADNTPDFFNALSDVRAALGLPASYFNPAGNFNAPAGPLPAGSLPTGIRATQHFKQVRTSYAAYGEGSYQITPTLKFTAGLRYTHDKNQFLDGITTFYDDAGAARLLTVSNFAGGAYFLQPLFNAAGQLVVPSFQASAANGGLGIPLPGGLTRTGSSGRISGRAILDWKPIEHVLVYGSYSRGYRSGTFNGLAYGSANQVYFVPPETVDAFEVGLKSRFLDNRAQFNVSAFYYKYKGQQGQVVDASATANLISLNGKLYGIEADAQYQPIPSLTLSATLGLLHTRYDDGACPANPALIPNFPAQLGSCVVSSGGPVSVGGNPFPYAAKSSATGAFDWVPINNGTDKLTIHGDVDYTGKFYFDSFKDYTAGPLPKVASGVFGQGSGNYVITNARVTFTHDRYTIAAWGKNLTNKAYYPFGISIENLFGNGYRVRGQPITYGVEATVRF